MDIETEGINPFCGDEVYLKMKLADGVVNGVSFRGVGCSISQASASMLTEVIKGKSLDEAESIYLLFRDMMQGKDPSDEELDTLGEVESLAGVKNFPIRIKCAMLSWRPWRRASRTTASVGQRAAGARSARRSRVGQA